MIKIESGRYTCNVGNCGGKSGCVHEWIPYFCPHCEMQLVRVKTNRAVFCSNHEMICDYSVNMRNKKDFLIAGDVLERKKERLIKEEKEIKKQLTSIRKQIKEFNA